MKPIKKEIAIGNEKFLENSSEKSQLSVAQMLVKCLEQEGFTGGML